YAGEIPEGYAGGDEGVADAVPVKVAALAIVESVQPENVVGVMQTRLVLQHGARREQATIVVFMREHVVFDVHPDFRGTAEVNAVSRGVQHRVELDIHVLSGRTAVVVPEVQVPDKDAIGATIDGVHVDDVGVIDRTTVESFGDDVHNCSK